MDFWAPGQSGLASWSELRKKDGKWVRDNEILGKSMHWIYRSGYSMCTCLSHTHAH